MPSEHTLNEAKKKKKKKKNQLLVMYYVYLWSGALEGLGFHVPSYHHTELRRRAGRHCFRRARHGCCECAARLPGRALGSGLWFPAKVHARRGDTERRYGPVVYQSLQELSQQVQQDGRTITAEAVDILVVAVPDATVALASGSASMGSVDTGAAALGRQYEAFVQQCPTSKVVLAGDRRGPWWCTNLAFWKRARNSAAALLVADGDRLPADPTFNFGTANGIPERGKGVAQDWPILAHAPAPLTPAMGARTISVCNLGDAVLDDDEDSDDS